MSNPKSYSWVSPSVLPLVLAVVFLFSIRNLFDADVWWHLASGRWMWEHHSILRADPFTFTVFGHPWIDHEWLFQLLLFAAYQAAKLPGVLIFKGFLIALSAMGFYRSLPEDYSSGVRA